jgi:hypothetical protein
LTWPAGTRSWRALAWRALTGLTGGAQRLPVRGGWRWFRRSRRNLRLRRRGSWSRRFGGNRRSGRLLSRRCRCSRLQGGSRCDRSWSGGRRNYGCRRTRSRRWRRSGGSRRRRFRRDRGGCRSLWRWGGRNRRFRCSGRCGQRSCGFQASRSRGGFLRRLLGSRRSLSGSILFGLALNRPANFLRDVHRD